MSTAEAATPRGWRRYTALGDSLTAGRGDMSAGRRVGWARRLADMLSGTTKVRCEFTNLARDGASTADVLANQVGQVEPAADLVSVTVGMNDVRMPRYSEQDFAERIATLLDRLTSTGATVLTCTLPDIADVVPLPPEHVEIARGRLRQASAVIRAQSARTGAICLDIWAMRELTTNPTFFTEDRLHPNATGHSMLATAFADLLARLAGLPGMRPTPGRVLLHGAKAIDREMVARLARRVGSACVSPRAPADAAGANWQLARQRGVTNETLRCKRVRAVTDEEAADRYAGTEIAEPEDRSLRLMAVHAHPDDESSKGAATMARYVREGVQVLVCTLTGGERGDILNKAMDRPEIRADLPSVRRAEMARAREILGVEQRFLGFIDSGLPEGDPLPPLPEGCFALEPLQTAAAPLVKAVREFRPHVMLTYDENGGYPHPDHVKCHQVSVEAFEAAADPDAYPDCGEPWQPLKLYYFMTFHRARIMALHEEMLRRGLESPYADRLDRLTESDERPVMEITTRIQCGDYFGIRDQALIAHATQVDPNGGWFACPIDAQRGAWPTEDYHLARSLVDADIPEDDLFAGIRERVSCD